MTMLEVVDNLSSISSPSRWDQVCCRNHHMVYDDVWEKWVPRRFGPSGYINRIDYYHGGIAPGAGHNTAWTKQGLEALNQNPGIDETDFNDTNAAASYVAIQRLNQSDLNEDQRWCIYTKLWAESFMDLGANEEEAISLKIRGAGSGTCKEIGMTWTYGATRGGVGFWNTNTGNPIVNGGGYTAPVGIPVEYMILIDPVWKTCRTYKYDTMELVAHSNYDDHYDSGTTTDLIWMGTSTVHQSRFRIYGEYALAVWEDIRN